MFAQDDTSAMVNESLSDFQTEKCLRVFNTFFDTNGDGVVDWDDFEKVLQKFEKAYGWQRDSEKYRTSMEALQRVWDGIKTCGDDDEAIEAGRTRDRVNVSVKLDKDGKITKDEWLMMWAKVSLQNPTSDGLPDWQHNYMDFLFSVSDTSGDLLIDKEEFTDTYRVYGLSEENCHKTFDRISTDGAISRENFARLWAEYFFTAKPDVKGNYLFGLPDF